MTMSWKDDERRIRASYFHDGATDREKLRALVGLLNDMTAHDVIADGYPLAEEAYELALSSPQPLPASSIEDAFHCLCDAGEESGVSSVREDAAARWRQRFGTEPPMPVYGFVYGGVDAAQSYAAAYVSYRTGGA